MPEVRTVSVIRNGKTVILRKGDWFKLTSRGEDANLGYRDDRAQLFWIVTSNTGGQTVFEVVRDAPHANWSDLGGRVSNGKGLRLYYNDLKTWFTPLHEGGGLQVTGDFVFKNKNLKGMGCRIISPFRNDEVFVEMAEPIGGGSCDGLGRNGHCVIIKEGMLGRKVTTKKKTTNKKRRKR